MHLESEGRGPPLVLIHGWAMHGGIFRPLRERLAERYTLHVVDLPGHGHSVADPGPFTLDACAAELLKRLPPAPWLGWSLGGLVAMRAASLRPERISALITLGASPCFVRADDWPHAVDAEVFASFGRDLGHDYRATIDRFLALEAHGSDHMRDELRSLREHVFERGEPAAQVLADGLRLLESGDLRSALPRLTMPSLWIAGRRDRLVPWQALQAAAAQAADGRFLRIDGGGHAPFLSHADEVAAAIDGLLAAR
jgi:pimeloyl-[acyl-carrier protein] methyl ester esterase